MTWPAPPAVPIRPMIARITSLAVIPSGNAPSTAIRMFRAGFCNSVCVASTCSTSEVPMPKASAPKAPWVAVWESPHTMVAPGRVKPCSGPTTWTMPLRASGTSNSGTPKAAQFSRRVSICSRESSASPVSLGSVAMLWSITASVRAGRRTLRPARRKPSKAWGLVTS